MEATGMARVRPVFAPVRFESRLGPALTWPALIQVQLLRSNGVKALQHKRRAKLPSGQLVANVHLFLTDSNVSKPARLHRRSCSKHRRDVHSGALEQY